MVEQKGTSPSCSSLPQVWGQLRSERQRQAIRLMAQLAFKLLMAQFEGPRKEKKNVETIGRTQSTS